MKRLWLAPIAGLLFLVGCLPNPVSVSRDGTIALTLNEAGEYELIQDKGHQVYLTNANAEFLTRVEGTKDCRFPVISPSGRYITFCSGGKLLLYDRETGKRRVVYRAEEGSGNGVDFPVWSPDGGKIAFFAGEFGPDDTPALKVYDVKRRELALLARRAVPQATWLPDSKRLLYISLPPGVSENEGPPFGDLKTINAKTGKQRTLARGQMYFFSKTAVFPEGKSVLYPCVKWDGPPEIRRAGLTAPLILRKELLPAFAKTTAQAEPGKAGGEATPEPERAETKSDVEEARPAENEQKPGEEGFVLEEGQPFYPFSCAVSPDGQRIAYIRPVWEIAGSAETQKAEKEETEGEKPNEVEQEAEKPETDGAQDEEAVGGEMCVAKADGTGSVVVARSTEDGGFGQVLWLTNTRLLCVGGNRIIAVDADGSNAFDLTEAIKIKFAGQFEQKKEEEEPESGQEEEGRVRPQPSLAVR